MRIAVLTCLVVTTTLRADGPIVVEVRGASGETLATSRPIRADGLDVSVEWESGAMPEPETIVTLRITLRNARLYALWTTE